MLNGFFTPLCPTSLLRNSCPMVCTSVFNYFLIHCRSLLLYFPPAFLVCRWYPEFFFITLIGMYWFTFHWKDMQLLWSDNPDITDLLSSSIWLLQLSDRYPDIFRNNHFTGWKITIFAVIFRNIQPRGLHPVSRLRKEKIYKSYLQPAP